MGFSYLQLVYVIYNQQNETVGVITNFKKAMQYIYDNPGHTCKTFKTNELIL